MPITPTKVSETLVPHIPGYRPMQQSVMPESLTDDILVEYAPILEDVTQPTLQTVFFKGAGEATPPSVQLLVLTISMRLPRL